VNRLEENLEQVTRAVAAYFADRKKLLRVRSPELAAFYVVEIGESLTMATMTKRPQVDPDVVIDEITDIIVRYVFK
jgi:hypothetical protein